MQVAGVQMNVLFAQVDKNLNAMKQHYKRARQNGAELVVFPECATTGYCFESAVEAYPLAESIPGPATEYFASVCRDYGGVAVFGMLEEAPEQSVYNAAAIVGAGGLIASYRKIHLPFLGIDRFSTFGDQPFAVHQIGEAKIGVNICYDAGFPESARTLALQGADIIALPTNWPPGASCFSAYAINTRAMENAVYFLAVNRVGTERGVKFIGRSRFCNPRGETIAQGDAEDEQILYAEVDLELARRKHVIRIPGQHEIDRVADRRPEMYGSLIEPHDLKRPGRA